MLSRVFLRSGWCNMPVRVGQVRLAVYTVNLLITENMPREISKSIYGSGVRDGGVGRLWWRRLRFVGACFADTILSASPALVSLSNEGEQSVSVELSVFSDGNVSNLSLGDRPASWSATNRPETPAGTSCCWLTPSPMKITCIWPSPR